MSSTSRTPSCGPYITEILDISSAQAYTLVRNGELTAIKVGGRGQWRVEATELESYIQRMYTETKTFVASHPFGPPADTAEETGANPANPPG